MRKKRILALSMIMIVCVLLFMPGCKLFCRWGDIGFDGSCFILFNLSINEITPQQDGTYRVSFIDGDTEDEVWTQVEMDEYGSALDDLYDPVIAQVPADVTDISATYDNNQGLTGAMTVRAGLQSVKVTPDITITPEAGQQLVIIDLPTTEGLVAGADDGDNFVSISVNAKVNPPRAIDIKVICSAKVTVEGTNYYLPLFPGVTDFSKVPSFTIPLSDTEQYLETPTKADLPETPDKLVYSFASADGGGDDGTADNSGDGQSDGGGGGGGGGGSCFIHTLANGR